jgi:Trp operon repressor
MKTNVDTTSADIPKNVLLLRLFSAAQNEHEMSQLLDALLTPAENEDIQERADIIRGILSGKTQREIAKHTGASLATVSRGSREVKFGSGILQKLFERVSVKF